MAPLQHWRGIDKRDGKPEHPRMMPGRLKPAEFVQTAVECTYYLTPSDPGLSHADLVAVGAVLSLERGEVSDALDENFIRAQGHLERHRDGRYLLSAGYPQAQAWWTWTDSPRSVSTYEAIADEILKHIRRHGKSDRRIELGPLIQAVLEKKHSLLQIEIELAMMQVAGNFRWESSVITLSEIGAAMFSTETRVTNQTRLQRPHFKEILNAIRPFVQLRVQGRMTVPVRRRIFISHSSQNAKLAQDLIAFLKAALVVHADEEIFCSSIPGHELIAGDMEEVEILKAINEVGVVIGLLTPDSLGSAAVLMELGAAWALRKKFVPLLNGATEFRNIPPWLNRHAVKLSHSAQDLKTFGKRLMALAEDVARNSGLEIRKGSTVMDAVVDFCETFRNPEPGIM